MLSVMKSKTHSLSNVSRDSGISASRLVHAMAKTGGHSRSVSNASSAYTACTEDSSATGYSGGSGPESADFESTNRRNKHHQYSVRGWMAPNRKCIAILIGFLLILASCFSYVYFPLLLKRIIQQFINLKPGEEFSAFWMQSSEPTEVGINFFHVKNPWAVEQGLENLQVAEMGTYMFQQRFYREIANFSDDMTIVNFTERRYFVFDAEKTVGCSLDDNITVVNVPYAALGSLIPSYVDNMPGIPMLSWLGSGATYRSINAFLDQHNQHLFINTTIRQLIYGYKLDLLDTAESYSSLLGKFGFDIMPTELFPNNSFGILNGRNGTPDGPYEMYTGLGGTGDQFGVFKTWKGKSKLDNWKGDSCNTLNGTDGTIWPAGVNKRDKLYFFVPDICRSLYVTFAEESTYKGIPTLVFSTPDELLAGRRTNPDNACFCLEEDEDIAEERCTLDGIFDMSGCQDGIPLIVSLPHFLGGDKRITEKIEGLKPNATKHRPELHVEPIMGTVIHGDSRLQMSIRVPRNENLRGFDNIKHDLYIPIFWGYKKLGMSDSMASELKGRLFVPVKLIRLFIVLLFIGGLCCIFGGLLFVILSYRQTVLTHIFRPDFESGGGVGGGIYYKDPVTGAVNGVTVPGLVIASSKVAGAKYSALNGKDVQGATMPRVESETSDLGDNKSDEEEEEEEDEGSVSCQNTPRSSTMDLNLDDAAELGRSLLRATETHI